MVTKRRHALSAETIRANALVASWTKEKLVPVVEVKAALASRQKREQLKKKPDGNVIELDLDNSGDDDGAQDEIDSLIR